MDFELRIKSDFQFRNVCESITFYLQSLMWIAYCRRCCFALNFNDESIGPS